MFAFLKNLLNTGIAGLLLLSISSSMHAAEGEEFSFALEPSFMTHGKRSEWQRVINYLEEKSGLNLRLVIPGGLSLFEDKLEQGTYDFAYMNPYQYTVVSKQGGYLAFAARRSQPMRGAVMVKKVGDTQSLEALAGKRIGFPHPRRFGPSVLNQIGLKAAGVDFERKFYATQEKAYQAAIAGEVDAVGTTVSRLDASSPEIHTALHVIWESPSYSPHAIAAQARVPLWKILQLKKAMIAMSKDNDEKVVELLAALQIKNGFQAAKDRDWNDARAIDYKSLNAPASE